MIKYRSTKQLKIEEFKSDFELKLDSNNRWVKLSSKLPWDDLVKPYLATLSKDRGAPAIDARIVVGSLYIKYKLQISDEEVIAQIQENPYMQYFLGLNTYHPEPLFDPSLFVEIRKRMGKKEFDKMNEVIIKHVKGKEDEWNKLCKNRGKLKIDATVADQYIKYPTDLDILNESREMTEKIIDEIFPKTFLEKKPRTYRRIARRSYLRIAKKKNKKEKELRKGIKHQLNYIKRNLRYINEMLDMFEEGHFPLSFKLQRYLWIIQEIYRQQKYMYENKTKQCDDRIVSIHQPYVRPIVRGKPKAYVEFGAKISMSLDNGFIRIDRLSWDAFNEGADLPVQVEAYKNIHGYYPEIVQGDGIYFTRENRRWLDERGIRYIGKRLGRPKKEAEDKHQKSKRKKEQNERNHIEGKFGQAKNGYGLGEIRARLKRTSESWISGIVFMMNVLNYLTRYC